MGLPCHIIRRAQRVTCRALKAIYPIGAYQVLWDKQTGAIVGQQNEPRSSIVKASGENVPTMRFLDRSSEGISAILMSFANALCYGAALGFDFELAHNPMSRAPIEDFVIPAKRAWRFNESSGELTGHILA